MKVDRVLPRVRATPVVGPSGETEYGIKAIPAGGYVKILGMTSAEEVDPADEPRTYRQRPFHNRLIVAVAGSAMHFVMAFALLWGLFVFIGAPQGNAVAISGFAPLAHNVDPARAAGLKPGDVVVRVNGAAVHSATELQSVIEDHTGTPVIARGGPGRSGPDDRPVTPALPRRRAPRAASASSSARAAVRSGPIDSVGKAGQLFGHVVTGSFAGIGQVFSASGITSYVHDLTNAQAASQAAKTGDRPQSIYGAARIAVQGAQAGATPVDPGARHDHHLRRDHQPLSHAPPRRRPRGHRRLRTHPQPARPALPRRREQAHPVAAAFVLLLGFVVVTSLYLDITHPVKNPFQ